MSTKDLIDRLTQRSNRRTTSRTTTRSAPSVEKERTAEVKSTRVKKGVIRRRRIKPSAEKPKPPAASKLRRRSGKRVTPLAPPSAVPTPATSAKPPAPVPPAPKDEKDKPSPAAALEAPNKGRGTPTAEPAKAPPATPEPRAAEPAAVTPQQPAAEVKPPPSSKPAPAPAVVEAKPAVDKPAPAADAAPAVVVTEAKAPVKATKVEPEPAAPAPAVKPVAEAAATQPAPKPAEPAAVTEPTDKPAPSPAAQPRPAAAKPATDAKPSETETPPAAAAAASEAQGDAEGARTPARPEGKLPRLPRLSRQLGPKGAYPGLGSAVVRPPPGYDPSDPAGNRRRAALQARQKRPTGPSRKPGPSAGQPGQKTTTPAGGRVWRDQKTGTNKPSAAKQAQNKRRRTTQARKRGPGRRGRVEMFMDDFSQPTRRRRSRGMKGPRKQSPQAKAIKRRVEFDGQITVAQLAHGLSVKSAQVIKVLINMGQMARANDNLDFDTAQLIAAEFEYEVINTTFNEASHLITVDAAEENMAQRPPVVTIMGHVDHGKTTLLDTIRKTRVAAGEAGGITQHIASYQVKHAGELITFIDTPGHEAFTEMRSRGAQVTDIVILVVAADDGVMPQTVEALNHARAADVQLLVAVNKCDRSNANPARTRQQMMKHNVIPEDYGGETIFVDISALKGDGVDEILDNILLLSELGEYTANADRHAEGSVIEGRLERGKGAIASLIVQQGTLKKGDRLVLGTTWGRVRALFDFKGKKIKEAGPSTPVEVMGLEQVPEAGDKWEVVQSERDAKALIDNRQAQAKLAATRKRKRFTLEDLLSHSEKDEILTLNLIIKSDVGGTLEAIDASLNKLNIPGTELNILHSGVGAVSESDVTLAHTYRAIIIGFNVRADARARKALVEYGVDFRTYKVIYEALDEVSRALKGLLAPTLKEVSHGRAEIRQTFNVPKIGTIAGCFVTEGKIARGHNIRLLRDNKIIWEGRLASLRRFKDDVREVEKGYECGMNLDGFNDIKNRDEIESFTKEEVQVT